ncbi:hypothetical protein C5167_028937 [Papaver somniferum]|nr:hypothetical protein C5167_028937 [Papaver somniferum]
MIGEMVDNTMQKQAAMLNDVSCTYERDKKSWVIAINNLERKIKSQLSHEAHECADSIPDLSQMVYAVQALDAAHCKEDISAGCSTVVEFEAAKDGNLGVLTGGSTKKTFKFDWVYAPKDGQADVFVDASPMVTSVLDGYNVCIFAYGQTGTGKTLEGPEHNREIRDLRATSPATKKPEIRLASEGVHHVPGIVEAKVENIKEVWDVLQAGSNARAVGSNNVNEHSSRSHCVQHAFYNDLAGSERLAKTDVQGERLKEAQKINRSLSALGDVTFLAGFYSNLLVFSSGLHLQLLIIFVEHFQELEANTLKDSLGVDSNFLMFVQISPSENDLGETLSSLNFATRVRGVELGPAKKQVDTAELQKLKTTVGKAMLDKARQESRFKDESLKKLEENIQNLEFKVRSEDQLCKSQQEKVKELESKLKEREHMESLAHQQKVRELENRLKERAQQPAESVILQQKVKELESNLKDREQNMESALLHQKNKELEEKL